MAWLGEHVKVGVLQNAPYLLLFPHRQINAVFCRIDVSLESVKVFLTSGHDFLVSDLLLSKLTREQAGGLSLVFYDKIGVARINL